MWRYILGVLGLGGLVAALGSRKGEEEEEDEQMPQDDDKTPLPDEIPGGDYSFRPGTGTPPPAMLAGDPQDPAIASQLAAIEDFMVAEGVPVQYWSAEEICRLPKGQIFNGRRAVAIPVYELWPNMVRTLELFQQIRASMGVPLNLRGYRPPDYNKAVGGASKSTHQWFSALDIYAPQDKKVLLALEGARVYRDNPGVGFGAYGKPTPSNIHIDTGKGKRTWREATYYLNKLTEA